MEKIKPGMRIFIGTGVSEPLTLVRLLKESDAGNLLDLELYSIGGPWRSDRDNRPALEQISPENLVFNPIHISRTPKVVEVLPAREIDHVGATHPSYRKRQRGLWPQRSRSTFSTVR